MVPQLQDFINDWYSLWARPVNPAVYLLLGLVVCLGIGALFHHQYKPLRNRLRFLEGEMARRRKKRRDRKYISDLIVEVFEREYNLGRMSHEMKWYWYKQFGNNCGLIDLLPMQVPRKNYDVKEDIQERRAAAKTKAKPILAALERLKAS
jgi:hypothetical protein